MMWFIVRAVTLRLAWYGLRIAVCIADMPIWLISQSRLQGVVAGHPFRCLAAGVYPLKLLAAMCNVTSTGCGCKKIEGVQ
jgi:hypothetical protein